MVRCSRIRRIRKLAYLLLALCLVAVLSTSVTQSLRRDCLPTHSSLEHTYHVEVSSHYANTSTHFSGTQILKLQSLDQDILTGHLTWNLSWDDGETWLAMNATCVYTGNRTYQSRNATLFTAWWIDLAVQLGDYIVIHGDPPATDYFLREGPFVVTDLVSLWLNSGQYACWLLTYETLGGQQERFYYERYTGLLVAAYSSQTNPSMPLRQMRLELQTANPPLPLEDLPTHLWLIFGPTLLALGIGVLAAAGTYRVLLRIRGRRFREWFEKGAKRNA